MQRQKWWKKGERKVITRLMLRLGGGSKNWHPQLTISNPNSPLPKWKKRNISVVLKIFPVFSHLQYKCDFCLHCNIPQHQYFINIWIEYGMKFVKGWSWGFRKWDVNINKYKDINSSVVLVCQIYVLFLKLYIRMRAHTYTHACTRTHMQHTHPTLSRNHSQAQAIMLRVLACLFKQIGLLWITL